MDLGWGGRAGVRLRNHQGVPSDKLEFERSHLFIFDVSHIAALTRPFDVRCFKIKLPSRTLLPLLSSTHMYRKGIYEYDCADRRETSG